MFNGCSYVQFWRAGAAAPPVPAAVQRWVGGSHPQTLSVPAEEDQDSTGELSLYWASDIHRMFPWIQKITSYVTSWSQHIQQILCVFVIVQIFINHENNRNVMLMDVYVMTWWCSGRLSWIMWCNWLSPWISLVFGDLHKNVSSGTTADSWIHKLR